MYNYIVLVEKQKKQRNKQRNQTAWAVRWSVFAATAVNTDLWSVLAACAVNTDLWSVLAASAVNTDLPKPRLLLSVGLCWRLRQSTRTTPTNCNHFGSSVGSMLLARTPCLLSFMVSIFSPLWKPLPIHGTNQTGGWRQQIAARERTPRGQVSRCPAALGLLQEWGEGILSTVRLHGHCLRLQRQPDYPAHPAIARLAAVGNREGDQNSHTNLVRLLF